MRLCYLLTLMMIIIVMNVIIMVIKNAMAMEQNTVLI